MIQKGNPLAVSSKNTQISRGARPPILLVQRINPRTIRIEYIGFVASLGDGVELRVSFQCGIRTNDEKSPKYVISTIYSAFDSTITLSGLPSDQFQPRRSAVWLRAPLQVRTLLRRTTTIQEWRGSPCDE